jgi:hypothetical protein
LQAVSASWGSDDGCRHHGTDENHPGTYKFNSWYYILLIQVTALSVHRLLLY